MRAGVRATIEYAVILFAMPAMSLGCSDSAQRHSDRPCGTSSAALFGGVPEPIGESVDDAVAGGAVFATAKDAEFCTMTRIAPGWMLTAKHCVVSNAAWVELTFGPDFLAARRTDGAAARSDCGASTKRGVESALISSALVRVVQQQELDLALLELELPEGPSIPLATAAASVGEPALLVGYGTQESGAGGMQESVGGVIASVEGDVVVVDVENGGACLGDSGGPLLRQTQDGAFELIGVLSTGSASCVSGDNYIDVTRHAAWIAESVGLP